MAALAELDRFIAEATALREQLATGFPVLPGVRTFDRTYTEAREGCDV